MSRKTRTTIAGYAFLLPWMIGFLGLTVFPMLASLFYSFNKYDMLTDPVWIGLDNYANMLGDERFWTSLGVTFRYVFLSVPLQLAFALLLANALKKDRPFVRVYRAIYYLPSLFGGERGHLHSLAADLQQNRPVQPDPGGVWHQGDQLDLHAFHRAQYADFPGRLAIRFLHGHLYVRAQADPRGLL